MPDWGILLLLQAIALEVVHRQRYGSCNSSQAISQVPHPNYRVILGSCPGRTGWLGVGLS